ncbi:Uncharacterized protein GBIM_10747 [Gryllus bimaculatus]|nr:Uncharacterized protein GBIM_10747 [Gryllus bimaculatus]
MSTRARCSPPPYSSQTAPPRPSVITCAPAATVPSSANHSWNQQQENSGSNRQGHRRELLSGMCDPVIDEHFRRSLGKDYLSVFSDEASDVSGVTDVNDNNANSGNSITVTGLSVDDHFAKALGDTWVKLQEQSAAETTSRSTPVSSLGRDKKPVVLPQQQQQPPRGLVSI